MEVAEMKVAAHHLFEESNKGKAACLAALDELYATDSVYHAGTGQEIHGLMNYKQSFSNLYEAFSDLHFTIDDMVVEGDKGAIRWTMTGTQKGIYRGIPPTHKKITIWFITIDRLVDGKIVEEWERFDTLGMMQQLGVIPKPP